MISSRDALSSSSDLTVLDTELSAKHVQAVYYPGFDWLRITLSSAVMVAHTGLVSWNRLGDFSVQIFFALSGWLIGGILLKTPREALPRFYFLRVVRIWIPYALALALLLGASLLRDPITPKWLEFAFYKLTFVYNLFGVPQLMSARSEMPLQATGNHFWSICSEEQFYLVAPLFLVLLPARLGRSLLLWIVFIVLDLWGFTSIAVGVLAALLYDAYGAWHLRWSGRLALVVVGLASCVAALVELVSYERAIPWLAGSIVLLLAFPGRKQRLGGFLGGVSYPLYLNHWIGLFLAHAIGKRLQLDPTLTTLALGLPLGLGIAVGMYLLVDRRVLASRDRWYSPRLAKTAMIAAYALMVVGVAGASWFAAQS